MRLAADGYGGLGHNSAMPNNSCLYLWAGLCVGLAGLPAEAAQPQATLMLSSPTIIRGVQVGADAPRVGLRVDLYGTEGWSAGLALDATVLQGDQVSERSGALRFSAPVWRRGEAEISLSAHLQAFDGAPITRRWNYMSLGATALKGPWALSWFLVPSALAADRAFFAGQAVDLAWQHPMTGGWSLDLSGGWVDVRTAKPGRYHHAQVGVIGTVGRLEWRAAWGRTDAVGQELFGTRAQEGYRLSLAWGL